jgi:GT2 family glycosyltransferase
MVRPGACIGIPTYRGWQRVRGLLENIKQRTDGASYPFTVVVCDDSGREEHRERVREACRDYRAELIEHPVNRGLPAGWNSLVRATDHEMVVLLNDDVLLSRDWLSYLSYAVLQNPKVATVSLNCRFITPDDATEILKGPEAKVIPLNVRYVNGVLIRHERFSTMPEQPDDWPGKVMCLPPGQEIVTDRGLLKIEDVCIGDYVLSHKGRWRRVWKTIQSDYEGLLYKILPSRVNLPFTVTEDHPILVASGEKCNYNGGYCTSKKAEHCRDHSDDRLPSENWVAPRDLSSGSFLMLPRFTAVTPRVRIDLADGIKLPELSRWSITKDKFILHGTNKKSIPRYVSITPDLLRFFGLFIAEGSTELSNGGCISFSFNESENDFCDLVQKVAKKSFNLSSSIHREKEDHSVYVNIHCLPLALALRHMFGEKANQKRIPWWMMELPPYLQKYITDGMLDGDGCSSIHESGYMRAHYDTVSPLLAWQFFQLLCRQEILCTFSKVSRKPTNEKWQDIYHFTMTQNPQGGFMDKKYVYLPIREITESPYKGKVYNLEVEEDESYCVPSCAVHNCPMGAAFAFRRSVYDQVGGFDERYRCFYEETDFGVACARQGMPSITIPVPHDNYHMWSATFASSPEVPAGQIMNESRAKFVAKWSEILGVKFNDAPEIHNLLMDKIPQFEVKWLGVGKRQRAQVM